MEQRKEQNRRYRAPPPIENSLFPDTAYETRNKPKGKIAASDVREGKVAAVSPSKNKNSKQTQKGPNTSGAEKRTMSPPAFRKFNKPEENAQSKEEAKKPDARRCYRCNKTGHLVAECPDRKNGIFCYRCKKEGVITPRCPACNPISENSEERD